MAFIFPKYPPHFNPHESVETFTKMESLPGFPDEYFYEVFILAKSTQDNDVRTKCSNIIKKQSPAFMKAAFKSRKKYCLVRKVVGF